MLKLKPGIPNSKVELMFLRVANPEQINKYNRFLNDKNTGLATAYCTEIVYNLFISLIDEQESYRREEK